MLEDGKQKEAFYALQKKRKRTYDFASKSSDIAMDPCNVD